MNDKPPDEFSTGQFDPDTSDLDAYPQDYGSLSLRRKSGQAARRRLNRSTYRIGREIGNDLVLPDPVISRYHARILCTPEGCHIEDLGSQNATLLNGERLPANEPQPLIENDEIRVGDYVLIYHLPEPIGEPEEDEFVLTFAEAPRPTTPMVITTWPLPPRSSYLQSLPSFFSKDSFLDRFLMIFESIMGPIDQLVDHMPFILDPQTQPVELLPWFASWLDLTLNENWPEARRRDLIRSASELYRWRGTKNGLAHYLEIYAGVTPEIEENLDQPHVFRVKLQIPVDQPVDETLVRTIIENEKPAHTSYELEIERVRDVIVAKPPMPVEEIKAEEEVLPEKETEPEPPPAEGEKESKQVQPAPKKTVSKAKKRKRSESPAEPPSTPTSEDKEPDELAKASSSESDSTDKVSNSDQVPQEGDKPVDEHDGETA